MTASSIWQQCVLLATAGLYLPKERKMRVVSPLKIVEPFVNASDQIPRIMRALESCTNLDQVMNCAAWLGRLRRSGTIDGYDSIYLLGALKATEHWLARRFCLEDEAALS